jgi:hypothetical protein
MPKPRKPKPAKAPGLMAALKTALMPYAGKHPAELILEHYETQARKLLKAEGLPVDLAELMQWHTLPKPEEGLNPRQAAAERAQWLKNFEEHHLRFFPEDRGKVLKPRQAALRGVLFQAERTREAIAAGDPQAAAAHSHRLAVEAAKTDLALYGEVQAERSRKPKGALGITYAIKAELTGPDKKFNTPKELWQHFEKAHHVKKYYEKARFSHGADHKHGKIEIEEADFSGSVYFEKEDSLIYQVPDPKEGRSRQTVRVYRHRGLEYKTFESYFYEIKNSLS